MENKITAIVTFIFFFLITFMGVIVDAFAGQLPAELWYGIGTIGSVVLAGSMSIPFIVKEFAEDSN